VRSPRCVPLSLALFAIVAADAYLSSLRRQGDEKKEEIDLLGLPLPCALFAVTLAAFFSF
jgi:hypothetical protein